MALHERLMGVLPRLALLATTLTCAACASDEGILLAVSGDEVRTLEVYVATQQGDVFILDKGSKAGGVSGLRVDVDGRNLRTSPFELLLEAPPEGAAPTLRALVLGLRVEDGQETIYSFGITNPPQPFVAGEVLRRGVPLASVRSDRHVSRYGGCLLVRYGDDTYRLLPDDDRDCDGSAKAKDCDDNDGEVFPGAVEYCDGKENNCDGKKAPEKVGCYVKLGDECKAGERACLEAKNAGPLEGDCVATGEVVAQAYCDAYVGCTSPDPQRCADWVKPKGYTCTLQTKPSGESCGAGEISLPRPVYTTHCLWRVVDPGPFEVSIVSASKCNEAKLQLSTKGAKSGKVVLEFFAGEERKSGWVRELEVTTEGKDPCEDSSSKRLTCK